MLFIFLVIDILDTAPQILGPVKTHLFGGEATRGQFVCNIRAFHTTQGANLSYSLLTNNQAFQLDKQNGNCKAPNIIILF